jgi:hypothetical protein
VEVLFSVSDQVAIFPNLSVFFSVVSTSDRGVWGNCEWKNYDELV